MSTRALSRVSLVLVLVATLSGCSTWDGMSRTTQATIGGAVIGGVAGAVFLGGPWATAGGAAVGGLVGNALGR